MNKFEKYKSFGLETIDRHHDQNLVMTIPKQNISFLDLNIKEYFLISDIIHNTVSFPGISIAPKK